MTDQLKMLYQLEEKPPILKAIVLGLQHVLVMFTAMIAAPYTIAGALGLDIQQTALMIAATMFACGIATAISAFGVGFIGSRYPIVMGASFPFVGAMLAIATNVGIAAAYTATFIGGLIEFAISPLMPKIKAIVPPLVQGTFVVIVGVYLIPIGMSIFLSDGQALSLVLGVITIISIIIFNRFLKGFYQAASLFFAIVIGYIVGTATNLISWSPVAEAKWFSFPTIMPFGPPQWPGLAGIAMVTVVFFISAVETYAATVATSSVTKTEPTEQRIRGAISIDGLGSSIAAIFGAPPVTSYSQNIGLVALTGVASRFVVFLGGLSLIAIGFIPKISSIIAIMPAPVIGAALLVLFASITGVGVQMLDGVIKTQRDILVFAISLAFALGVTIAPPGSFSYLPQGVRLIVENGFVLGALLAIVLNLVLPKPKEEKEINNNVK